MDSFSGDYSINSWLVHELCNLVSNKACCIDICWCSRMIEDEDALWRGHVFASWEMVTYVMLVNDYHVLFLCHFAEFMSTVSGLV